MSCEFKLGEPVLARVFKFSDWEEVVFIAYDEKRRKTVCADGQVMIFPYLCAKCSAREFADANKLRVGAFSEVKEFPITLRELEEQYHEIEDNKAKLEEELHRAKEMARRWGE